MLIIAIAFAVCIVGLFLYVWGTGTPGNQRLARIGEIMFAVGLLATLLAMPTHAALHF